MTRRPIFPTPPPPPSLAAVMGGGVQGGGARPAVPGGGGVNPTSMAQNDTNVALIILTTQMWGGKLLVEKTFLGQILRSCAFGANIRSYTKQRARHGTPSLQPPPPPLSFGGRPCHPPPPAEQFSGYPVISIPNIPSPAPNQPKNLIFMEIPKIAATTPRIALTSASSSQGGALGCHARILVQPVMLLC